MDEVVFLNRYGLKVTNARAMFGSTARIDPVGADNIRFPHQIEAPIYRSGEERKGG